MSQQNPYAIHDDAMAVINAPADARAIFLQKTYSLMLAAVAVFVSTLWGTAHITPLANMANSLWNISPWISLILFMGGAIAVHALAGTRIGIFVFFGFAFLWGLISAPLILYAAGTENGPAVIGQAAIITAFIFIFRIRIQKRILYFLFYNIFIYFFCLNLIRFYGYILI